MDLHQYITALRKGWWIILVCAALGTGAAALVNVNATPQYASTVTFFISTPTEGGTSPLAADQFATRRITSYVGLLSSDVTAQRVLDDTGVDLSVGQVSARISGDSDLNTVLLTATVTDSSPERSLLIAEGLAATFGEVVDEVDPIGPDQVVLRVISGPTLNPQPVSPRSTFNLALGFGAGLVVGVAIALGRQLLDNTVRQPQLLATLTGAPVLGAIPFDKSAKRSPLILDTHARSVRAEAFRQVRTSLQFIDVERPVHVLVVTSSVSGEGKSTTSVNLAVAFADSGRRVLLIEADLRRPRVSEYLGLERAVGLTNVLAGQVAIDEVVQRWGRSGLSVLPSGSIPPNPSELLGSPAMVDLLTQLRAMFDVIVIDTPPLLPVTDGAVAAVHSDGAVLVVRYAKTTKSQITTAVQSLRSVDARLLGTIVAMSPPKGGDGYEAYGYNLDEGQRQTEAPIGVRAAPGRRCDPGTGPADPAEPPTAPTAAEAAPPSTEAAAPDGQRQRPVQPAGGE